MARKSMQWLGPDMNTSQALGVTIAGEFSGGYNDCGLFVRGMGLTPVFGGDCAIWDGSSNWDASTKAGVKAFVMASMDAVQNWYFWTWNGNTFFLSFSIGAIICSTHP